MIDAKDLVLFEDAKELLVERTRRREIGAERLFDDDAPPGAVLLARQPGLAEMCSDRREAGRRRRQIKQAIAFRRALALDAVEFLADFLIGRFVIRVALDIGDAAEQALDHAVVDRTGGKFRQAFGEIGPEGFARRGRARDADQGECLGQQTGGVEIVEGREQQAVGEVARRAENHQTTRVGHPRRGGGGPLRHEGLAFCSWGLVLAADFGSTCAPKPLRIADRIFSAKV